jgi:hypothetical protein
VCLSPAAAVSELRILAGSPSKCDRLTKKFPPQRW